MAKIKVEDNMVWVLLAAVRLYSANFLKFCGYMLFPVLGQVLGLGLIFGLAAVYMTYLPDLALKYDVLKDFSTIILSENTVDLYNPKVLRATQGMLFHMNIISRDVVNWLSTIAPLGIPIYGTKVDGGFDPRKLSKTEKKKFVLIVGNEGNGVSSRVLDLCSKNLCIPTNIRVESLNVAVATSILLYELGN